MRSQQPTTDSPRASRVGHPRPDSQSRLYSQNDRNSQSQNEDGASLAGSRSGNRNPQYPPNEPPLSPHDPDPFFSQQAMQPASNYAQSIAPSGRYITQQQPPMGKPPSPSPLLDHSHLRPGKEANLLSHERTLELYRANARKSNDPDVQFEFAVFMIDASKSLPLPPATGGNQLEIEKVEEKREELTREGVQLLKRLADRGHGEAQYFLADCMANGIGTHRSRQDFDRAYPMFVLAAKHGHADAAYRAGTCCENGWGCRRESAKAVQFFRKAAAALHPGALYRLGIAELNGELGLSKRPKEGVKWLKRSAEHATAEFPHALHELALLHERGVDNVLFVDYEYAAELLAQAAELGYAPSAYRLGECYEYGKMGCPQDAALSIHYYVSFFYRCVIPVITCVIEHRRPTRSSRRLLRADCVVLGRIPWRASSVRHRGLLVGQEGCRTGPRKSNVCCWVLFRGRHHRSSSALPRSWSNLSSTGWCRHRSIDSRGNAMV